MSRHINEHRVAAATTIGSSDMTIFHPGAIRHKVCGLHTLRAARMHSPRGAHQPIMHTLKGFCSALVLLFFIVAARRTCAASDTLGNLDAALRELARKVAPAVVEIQTLTDPATQPADDQSSDDDAQESSAPETRVGAGVIVDSRGYIVTNAHLVEGALNVTVTLEPGAVDQEHTNTPVPLSAHIAGVFKEADIAILKVDAEGLSPIRIAQKGDIKQGQLVAAFGSPAGLHNSLSLGVVSSAARQVDRDGHISYIQTDAAINHGNSGGPLVDINGNLVGVTTMYISEGGGSEGLGFAIPAPLVLYAFEEILHYGQVRWADSGLRVQGLSHTLAHALGLPRDFGVVVSDVIPGSAAETVGLRPRDLITALDGKQLDSVPQYFEHMYHKKPGDKLLVSLNRDGHVLSLEITLTAQAAEPQPREMPQSQPRLIPRLGIVCSQLGPHSHADNSSLRSHAGLLVERRLAKGGDVKADLTRGDVIRSVNRTAISTIDQIQGILGQLPPGTPIVLHVERKGELIYVLANDPD